jgi:hypothetical protein
MFFSSNISTFDIKNDTYGFNERIEIKRELINNIISKFNNFITEDFLSKIPNDHIIQQIENIQNYNKLYVHKLNLVDSLDYENTYIKFNFIIIDDFKYEYAKFIKIIKHIIKKESLKDNNIIELLKFLNKQYKFQIMLL